MLNRKERREKKQKKTKKKEQEKQVLKGTGENGERRKGGKIERKKAH